MVVDVDDCQQHAVSATDIETVQVIEDRLMQGNFTRILSIALGICSLAGCTLIERWVLPEAAILDSSWAQNEPASTDVINHESWQRFLDQYVVTDHQGINRVDYSAVSNEDKAALDGYLDHLQSIPILDYRRSEQLAYWVNLYNAKTVDIVLDHYPVESIRDIKLGDGWIVIGPWSAPVLRVAGRLLSLNDIEHSILRPIWRDQRIHYVLNCAAVGCPNLSPSAYDGRTIDNAMTVAAKAYVNHSRGVYFDEGGNLRVSKIYAWFREDFGNNQRDVLRAIGAYAAAALKKKLAERQTIDAYGYDWSLNDARNAGAAITAGRGRFRQQHFALPNVRPEAALSSS